MQLNEYQSEATRTAQYSKDQLPNLVYPLLGLIGEVGEIVQKIRKAIDTGDIQLNSPIASVIVRLLDVAAANGETAELIKKSIRGGVVPCSTEITVRFDTAGAGKELGDVLWYLSQAARELGFTLGAIGQANLDKLQDRLDRGVIHGDGDDR